MLSATVQAAGVLPSLVQAVALPALVLVGYRIAANQSLRTYIAVEQLEDAPLPVTEEDKASYKCKRWRRIIYFLLFTCFIWGTEGYVIAIHDFDMLSTFVSALFGIFMAISTYNFTCQLLGLRHAVYRQANGMVLSRIAETGYITMAKKGLSLITAALANYFVLVNFNSTVATLCIATMVAQLTSHGMGKLSSIRKLTIVFIAYEAIIVALSVVMIWAAAAAPDAFDKDDALFPTMGEGGDSEKMMLRAHSVVIPAIYAVPVGQYLAACARFDYSQAKKAGLLPAVANAALEVLPAVETCTMPRSSTGRVVPHRRTKINDILPAQYRIYGKLTFRVAAACYLILAPMVHFFVHAIVPATNVKKHVFDIFYLQNQLFALATMFVTVPILALAVAFKARGRNEKKALWTYNEVWYKKPGQDKQDNEAAHVETVPLLEKPEIVIEDVDMPVKQ